MTIIEFEKMDYIGDMKKVARSEEIRCYDCNKVNEYANNGNIGDLKNYCLNCRAKRVCAGCGCPNKWCDDDVKLKNFCLRCRGQAPEPSKSKHLILFFFEEIEEYAQKLVFEELTKHITDGDETTLCLPPAYASSDQMGHIKPICREPAKKIVYFMTNCRKLPAHKIPKVTMGGNGMDKLKRAAAAEVLKYQLEEEYLDERKDELFGLVRQKSVELYHVAQDEPGKLYMVDDALGRAKVRTKQDELRYVSEMERYLVAENGPQCDCARASVCKGFRCLCTCFFCLSDRKHVIAKCDCSKPERVYKAKQILPHYNPKEPARCSCEKLAHDITQGVQKARSRTWSACSIRGCSCCCGYCLRMKSNFMEMSKLNDAKYCGCYEREICIGYGCPCTCLKCSMEKQLLGYCPQQQFM